MLHRGKIQALLTSGNKDDILIGIHLVRAKYPTFNMRKLVWVLKTVYKVYFNTADYYDEIFLWHQNRWISIHKDEIYETE